MTAAILIFAAQAMAATAPSADPPRAGTWVRAAATVEILEAATTRDRDQDRPIWRHRRTAGESRVTLEFE